METKITIKAETLNPNSHVFSTSFLMEQYNLQDMVLDDRCIIKTQMQRQFMFIPGQNANN